jgi:carbamate kinase
MNTPLRIVVALGGNAISEPHRRTIPEQFARSRETANALADAVEAGHRLLLTHGNGPQVGSILRRVELAIGEVYPIDLGLCVADSQSSMGYMIAQCMTNELAKRGVAKYGLTIVTTVLVNKEDPAFTNPSKPIGRFHPPERAEAHRREDGWKMVEIPGKGYRRVVASPKPQRIMELAQIRRLFDSGELLVASGGGGIPVVWTDGWGYEGVEAVIDKDLSAALLAIGVEADVLAILTDQDCVYDDFGTPDQKPLPELTVEKARRRIHAGQFPAGSMAPKIEAAVSFLEGASRPGAFALVTRFDRLIDGLAGRIGTRLIRG